MERRLAAILSADVAGYGRLMARDEEATVETLGAHRDFAASCVQRRGGRVVDAVGDNLLAEFPSIVEAVGCGIEIQRGLAERNQALAPERQMRFRIGINLGDVIVEGDRIYGDGVNIAARIEALADEGGVSISGTAYDQVVGKLDVGFEDRGTHELKNVAMPVRVYRVDPVGRFAEAAPPPTVPGFGGRPAIAVLPFEDLGGDAPDRFAEGVTEDLITRLSRFRWFPVISRESTASYAGRRLDAKEVGRQLGARYVVAGSVRRAGGSVRVNAELVDTSTARQVWAERYDRELGDLFALQDEISGGIIAAVNPELLRFEEERAVRLEPRDLDAWECAQRGWWHLRRLTRDDNAKARALFAGAVERDAQFVWALAGLAFTHYEDLVHQWSDTPARSIAELARVARAAVALDDKDPSAQVALGTACSVTGSREEMLAAFELAVELNPSAANAYYYLGLFLALAGRPEQAIARLETGMRLSPRDPSMWEFLYAVAVAHFAARRYGAAVEFAQRSLRRKPDHPAARGVLAAGLSQLGRIDEARAALAEIARSRPGFSARALRAMLASAADAELLDRLIDGLRRAGLEE